MATNFAVKLDHPTFNRHNAVLRRLDEKITMTVDDVGYTQGSAMHF